MVAGEGFVLVSQRGKVWNSPWGAESQAGWRDHLRLRVAWIDNVRSTEIHTYLFSDNKRQGHEKLKLSNEKLFTFVNNQWNLMPQNTVLQRTFILISADWKWCDLSPHASAQAETHLELGRTFASHLVHCTASQLQSRVPELIRSIWFWL